ncbi:MAG: signal peptidase I [Actinomycetota bacterium]|nr:signal peptidase I [Actinomycetota bacterium]
MPQVHEVARELGITSTEAVSHLNALGVSNKTSSSPIDEDTADRLRTHVKNGSGRFAAVGAPPPPPPPNTADAAATQALPQTQQAETAASATIEPADASETGSKKTRKKPKKRRSLLRQLTELPVLIVLAFLIAIVIKTFLVQAIYIPSGSMIPTLRIGDRVLVEKISYRLHDPRHDDVVVFAKSVVGQQPPDVPWYDDARNFFRELLGLPTGTEEDYIKRVIGVGGDTIKYSGTPRVLTINGEKQKEPFINHGVDNSSPTITSDDCKRLKMKVSGDGCLVPAGDVFVMGDNRGNSEDSRIFGPISTDKIVGRAFVIIWPPSDFGGI